MSLQNNKLEEGMAARKDVTNVSLVLLPPRFLLGYLFPC
uniref:Uncharacterized protein n=1 Tax=Rhizophora mucronata TaxID=61149 RepID=A0A2P2NYU9_RHIMU